MESLEISPHQIRVYDCIKAADRWITVNDICKLTGMPNRTVNRHAQRLTKLGILDSAEMFPANHYRISSFPDKRDAEYVHRLEKARLVFGPELVGARP